MTDSLHNRLRDLYDKMREFPEASRCEHGTHLKPSAFAAFLDLRQLVEKEVLPALYRIEEARNATSRPSPTSPR
ncbi:hypothetical protein [Novosphingobium sp.]|uniref:hypothetical protein n=1 Tax=Novosphingobium sp. TaxID=1874826 RepID=UPI003BA947E3